MAARQLREAHDGERPHPAAGNDSLRLLIVVPFAPRRDNRHGGRVVAQLLDHLTEHHEVAVIHLDRGEDSWMEPSLVERCALVQRISARRGRWVGASWRSRLAVLKGLITGRPNAVDAVHSRRLARAVRSVARTWQPDIVQIEGDVLAYCANGLTGSQAATVLVVHDPGLPVAQQLVAATMGRQRMAHRIDVASWHRYWSRTLPGTDAQVTFTADDAATLARAAPDLHPTLIPLGIDVRRALNPAGYGAANVVFVGGYAHTPNIDAALRLMRSIMPQVRRSWPGAHLAIVGDSPSEEMVAAAGGRDEVTGYVSDVEPFLDRASVVALPIRLGGGMRVKLLEALASGKAVVASAVAVAGLPGDAHEVLRIADTDDEFAAAICALIADEAERVRLAHAARLWSLANLSWAARVESYERLYRALVDASELTNNAARR